MTGQPSTRPDLLALSTEALVDLTNVGTVRRATKELDTLEVRLADDGSGVVVAEASDGTRCELRPGVSFALWPCTCLAGSGCRHVVRAVLAYQRAHRDRGAAAGPPGPGPDRPEGAGRPGGPPPPEGPSESASPPAGGDASPSPHRPGAGGSSPARARRRGGGDGEASGGVRPSGATGDSAPQAADPGAAHDGSLAAPANQASANRASAGEVPDGQVTADRSPAAARDDSSDRPPDDAAPGAPRPGFGEGAARGRAPDELADPGTTDPGDAPPRTAAPGKAAPDASLGPVPGRASGVVPGSSPGAAPGEVLPRAASAGAASSPAATSPVPRAPGGALPGPASTDAVPGGTGPGAASPGAVPAEPVPDGPVADDAVPGTTSPDATSPGSVAPDGAPHDDLLARTPADVTDDELERVFWKVLGRVRSTAAAGALAHVSFGRISVVRFHHPTTFTVRFLLGADLAYTRCDCTETDPCQHAALAVLVARAGEGLVQTGDDTWTPDPAVLDELDRLTADVVTVGAEAARGVFDAQLTRLAAAARAAQLGAPAAVLDELAEELARYRSADSRFTGERMVALLGELAARVRALRGGLQPTRLVAGSTGSGSATQGSARLAGLGTEVVGRGETYLARALLVDLRTGSPAAVEGVATGADASPARAAARRVAGVAVAQWGGGQTLLPGATRDTAGVLRPGRRRVSVLPGHADFAALGPPHAVESLAELAAQHDDLPALVGARGIGQGLAALRVHRVASTWFDVAAQSVVAVLVDADGATALLELPWTVAQATSVDATAAALAWCVAGESTLTWVAGRWRRTAAGPVVTPTLLAVDGFSLQPQTGIAPTAPDDPTAGAGEAPSGVAGVVAAVQEALGDLAVGGLDRFSPDRLAGVREAADDHTMFRLSLLLTRLADAPSPETALDAMIWASVAAERVG